MAQYLLLEFDNDSQCQKLREKIDAANEAGRGFRVIGLFQKPVKFCECPEMNLNTADHEGRMYDHRQLRRGSKFGWQIHFPGCNRTVRRIGISPRNLLEDPPSEPWYRNTYPAIHGYDFKGYPLSINSQTGGKKQ